MSAIYTSIGQFEEIGRQVAVGNLKLTNVVIFGNACPALNEKGR